MTTPGWFFQFAFAAAAATIVAGALAGRTKYSAYLIYTVFVTGLIYPVVVHWGWDTNTWMGAFTENAAGESNVWLGNGYVDFAGSGIVHTVGGIAGLMGAIVVGARLGKYGPSGEVRAIPGHNISIATIGMFILWFGWYGFNPGSTLALSGGGAALAASVAVTTTLAAGAGGVTAMLWSRFRTGRYDTGLTINGILAGLVAITAGTATVDPWAAVVIGAIGALVMYYGVQMLDGVFRIDDPVGAVSVHAFAGIWGVIAVGLFSSEAGMAAAGYANPQHYGLFLGGGGEQLLMQLIGIAAIVGWTAATAGSPLPGHQVHHRPPRERGRRDAWARPHRTRHRRLPGLRSFWFRHLRRQAGGASERTPHPASDPESGKEFPVKKIEAIIRPSRLEPVKDALDELGFSGGITVWEVKGHGKQRGITEQWRGREYRVEYLSKVYLTLVVADDKSDAVVDAIVDNASSGEIGDGKVFISNVEDAVRVRTRERGDEAL